MLCPKCLQEKKFKVVFHSFATNTCFQNPNGSITWETHMESLDADMEKYPYKMHCMNEECEHSDRPERFGWWGSREIPITRAMDNHVLAYRMGLEEGYDDEGKYPCFYTTHLILHDGRLRVGFRNAITDKDGARGSIDGTWSIPADDHAAYLLLIMAAKDESELPNPNDFDLEGVETDVEHVREMASREPEIVTLTERR